MIIRDVASAAFLALAALAGTIAAIGLVRSRNNFAALHCTGAAAVLVPLLSLVGLTIRIPAGQPTIQMLLVTAILLAGAPITSHVIGMAEYRRKPR